jgi:hypothetical protein
MNDEGAAAAPPHRHTVATQDDQQSVARWALSYAQLGWSVVPAAIASKRALVPWKPWQQTPADLDQVRAWWHRWPRANVAVITGRVSNLVVLDLDTRHDGWASLAKLEATYGAVPDAATVETPSGGLHLYLRHPGGRVANSAGRLGDGLDTRGDGGLALAPPSRRYGGAYAWAVGGPETIPAMPEWLHELVRRRFTPPPPPARPAILGGTPRELARFQGLLDHLAAARAPVGRGKNKIPGDRNARLFWCACRLAELLAEGAPPGWAELLVQAGVAVDLDEREARATVASGLGQAFR